MAAPTSTNEVTARKLSASISALWTKIKSMFQPTADRVTAWGSTPSDTKYPSEKLVKDSLDGKLSYFDATYMRNNVAGDGWVKLADVDSIVRSSGDINGAWEVILVGAAVGIWRESITLDVRFNASGAPQIILFNRVYENVKKTGFEFCVKVIGLAGSGNSNVELWAKLQKGWYSAGIREVGASNIATKIKWNYYSYSSNGGSSKPVADAGNNIQVADPSYIGGDDFVKVAGGTMTGPLNGYMMSTRATMVGNEYNCLLNAQERGILTFTQSGTGQLTEAQVWQLFDGKIIPQYGTAIDPEDPYILTLDLSSFISYHCQVFSAFGWTCRYWEPLKFKVELYDTYNNVNEWVTICDYSQTQYTGQYSGGGTASLFVKFGSGTVNPHTGVTRGGVFKKIRITIWKGNESTNRWGISEIFFCYPENYSVYGGLAAFSAKQLATARKLKTNLARTADSTFDGSANQENIPVTGVLPVGNGGTGQASAVNACNAFINALSTGTSTPQDDDYYVAQFAGGGTTTTTFHRRPVKALWEYIKGKISSVLGLSESGYTGNAATATALSAGADRTKLDGIAAGAEVNVQSDWTQTTTTADDYIKNKPTLGTAAAKDVPTSGNASTTQVVMGNDTRLTNARLTTGPKYYDLYNSGTAMYGWHIGSSNVPDASNDGFFKAVICISRWTTSNTDSKPEECFGYLDITHRNSSGNEDYYARIYAIGGVTTADNMGWAVMAIRGDSSKKIDWYVVRNPDNESASGEVGINFGALSVIPMVNTGSSFILDTSLAHMTSKWTTYLNYYMTKRAPYLTASQVGVGSNSEPVYVDNGQIKKCTGVQPSLSTQTAYTSKGSATKVPQITTNSLGQVTGITEVTISGVTPAAHTHNTDANDVTNNAAGSDLSEVTDTTEIVTTNIAGYSSSDKQLYRRPAGSKLWPWIKSKLGISSAVGSSTLPVYFDSNGQAKAIGSDLQVVKGSSDSEATVRASYDGNNKIYLCSSSTTNGIAMYNGGTFKWMCSSDRNGNATFNGNATSATTATTASSANYLKYQRDNEINFKNVPSANNGGPRTWFNYCNGDSGGADSSNKISDYFFGNRNNDVQGVRLHAEGIAFRSFYPQSNEAFFAKITLNSNGWGTIRFRVTGSAKSTSTGNDIFGSCDIVVKCRGDENSNWHAFYTRSIRATSDTSALFLQGIYYESGQTFYIGVRKSGFGSRIHVEVIDCCTSTQSVAYEPTSPNRGFTYEIGDFNSSVTGTASNMQGGTIAYNPASAGSATGSANTPVFVDAVGKLTQIGPNLQVPQDATESYVRVSQTNGATAYLDAWQNKGGVYVNNGGSSGWLCYRDSNGKNYFEGASKYIYDHNNGGFVKLEVGRMGTDANTLYII